MRWNLLADYDQQAADQFLACYQATTGTPLSDQPYWDMVALLDLLLDTGEPASPGRHPTTRPATLRELRRNRLAIRR
jgi:hypothetical protein